MLPPGKECFREVGPNRYRSVIAIHGILIATDRAQRCTSIEVGAFAGRIKANGIIKDGERVLVSAQHSEPHP